jgi:hypothetical protein
MPGCRACWADQHPEQGLPGWGAHIVLHGAPMAHVQSCMEALHCCEAFAALLLCYNRRLQAECAGAV